MTILLIFLAFAYGFICSYFNLNLLKKAVFAISEPNSKLGSEPDLKNLTLYFSASLVFIFFIGLSGYWLFEDYVIALAVGFVLEIFVYILRYSSKHSVDPIDQTVEAD